MAAVDSLEMLITEKESSKADDGVLSFFAKLLKYHRR